MRGYEQGFWNIVGADVRGEEGGSKAIAGTDGGEDGRLLCGGMTAIYQVEKLHIIAAIMLHGGVLYAAYLVTYLINNWLEGGLIPFLVFSGIFVVVYAIIWVIIYAINRRRIAKINTILKTKQKI